MTDFLKIIKEKAIDYIQFHFTTILGELKAVEFPANLWQELKDGTGVDGSSLSFLTTEQSDMRIVPDYNTFSILPWNPRVGRFICDLTDNQGAPYPLCPRGILKKIVNKAKLGDFQFQTRPELEWYFVTKEFKPADNGGYMDTIPKDKFQDLRRRITDDMLKMDIGIKTIHHEFGAGQQEVELVADNALQQADNVQTAKLITKVRAFYDDLISTYMPKPFEKMAGSGLHLHLYLIKNNENIFSDRERGISEVLKYFIGGIQHHIKEITAILNPITNSYKRLTPHHEAPVHVSWGIGNRTALIRVPGYEKSSHIEYRAGDGMMNIYLGSAILLAAGLDGIKKRLEPNKPTLKNVDLLTEEERQISGIGRLPKDLKESLDAFEQSSWIKKIFGKVFIQNYVKNKRAELQDFSAARSKNKENEWELERYINS